ncbi:MAG: hypothetical protein N2513_01825 [Deltaproteobacteria bacterium]|nr:hypothetical protein [Deltaproteobacteria bacterium]
MKVERHEDKVIYQIESDKGDQKKDKGEISSIVKSLEVIIDNGRGTHGKRKTDNCR